MTRQEHLNFCKQRALEYVDIGDYNQAITSMLSNLSKHEGTKNHVGTELGIMLLTSNFLKTADKVRDFINGKSPKDHDLATNATPEQMAHILNNAGFKVRGKTGPDGKIIPDFDRTSSGKPLKLSFDPEIAGEGDNKIWYLTGRDSSDEQKPFVLTAVVKGNEYEMATFRKDAKVTKNFELSDQIRDLLIKAGIKISDQGNEYSWEVE